MEWNSWLWFKLKIVVTSGNLMVLIILILPFIFSSIRASDISKREAQIISIIEEQALNLDSRKFYYDPIMVQSESHSIYTDPKKKAGQDIIFRKPNSDFGRESIALSSVENKWAIPSPRGGKKRQFILLRRAPNGISVGTPGSEKSPYFGSFVYITNYLPNITSDAVKTFDVSGQKSMIEFDVWETRPRMDKFYAGWDTCDYTLMFTCESLQDMMMTASEELETEKEQPKRRRRNTEALQAKTTNMTLPPPRRGPFTPIKAEPGYDPNEYNDLYLDLDIHMPEPVKPKKKNHMNFKKMPFLGGGAKKETKTRKKRFFGGKGRSMGAEVETEAKRKSDRKANKLDKGTNFLKAMKGGNAGTGNLHSASDVSSLLGGNGGKGAGSVLLGTPLTLEGNSFSSGLGSVGNPIGGILPGGGEGQDVSAGANTGLDLALGGGGGGGPANLLGGLGAGANPGNLLGGLGVGVGGDAGGGPGNLLGGILGAAAPIVEAAGDLVGTAVGLAGEVVNAAAETVAGVLGGGLDPLSLFGNLGADGVLGGLSDVGLKGGIGGGGGPLGLLTGLGGGADGEGGPLDILGGLSAGVGGEGGLPGLGSLGDVANVGLNLGAGGGLPIPGLGGEGGLPIPGLGAEGGLPIPGLGVEGGLPIPGLGAEGGLPGLGALPGLGGEGGLGALSGLLGGDLFNNLQASIGGDALSSLTGALGPEGLASLTGMIGVDGVAQIGTQLGPEGLAQLGGLVNGGLPLPALVGMFGGDNPLANVGVGVGGDANPLAKISGRGLGGLGDALDIGKVLGNGGGVLGSLANGIVGSAGDIITGPIASAIGSTIDKLVGGGLGDVDLGSITGAISGITDGSLGAPAVLSTLLSGGLGSGGSINSLLKGNLFDAVNDKFHHLAGDLAGNILDFFSVSGDGGVPGDIGGVISNILGGDNGPAGILKMATGILGPIASVLDPVNQVAFSAFAISNNLPVLGKALGQNIIKQLPNVIESLGLGGLVQAMGIGPIAGAVHGLADQIIAAGESLISTIDILGNGIIDGAADVLVELGVPREFATLAATGAKLACMSEWIKVKGVAVGVRLGCDLIGSQVNAGNYRGAGAGPSNDTSMQNWQAMMNEEGEPSNALTVFGYTFPGCGEEKDFFYPDTAYVRSLFKPEKGGPPVPGYHLAGVEPGMFDLFYPDDPKANGELDGNYGVLTPESYKQPHRDANHGVRGKFGKHGMFVPDSPAKLAVIHPDNEKAKELFCMPADIHTKYGVRPKRNAQDKVMIYGYLFNGIRESPHIFVAEGNILTGFFVPDDPDYPEIADAPHGMFIPDNIAGHARFVLEDKTEFADVKEVRGAFFPDAMMLAGAVGGRLSKSRTEQGVYNFVMDRLAVEFVYVKGHPAMKNIWAAFLSKEEWNYMPGPIPPPEETRSNPKTEDEKKKEEKVKEKSGGKGIINLNLNNKGKVKDHFGIRIQSQRTEAFLPKDFDIEGIFLPLDKDQTKKRMPLAGALNVGKSNSAWTFRVLKKHPQHTTVEGEMACLFVPTGYPKDDALVGVITMDAPNENGEITFAPKQTQTEYFYEKGDEIWVPPKFAEKVAAAKQSKQAGAPSIPGQDDDDATYVPKPGEADAESMEPPSPEENGVPGVVTKTQDPPERLSNYYFGPWHDNTSAEFFDDSLKTLPHVYQYGYYYFDPESPGPLFIPEVGALGKFIPDGGGEGHDGYFFPSKLEKDSKSSFAVKAGGSAPPGGSGKFYTTLEGDTQSMEYFRCSLPDPKNLEPVQGVEVIPGWELADTIIPKTGDGDFEEERLVPTREPAKYRLINIGGGFKGVVVNSPVDLDNPNNPTFQRFLHYKANRDGDVNPWGNVIILDPIVREASKNPKSLGPGTIKPAVQSAPTISKKLLEKFTLINWEWPLSKEGSPGWKQGERLKLGTMSNIVNMLDFRMWLLTKYDCKYFQPDGNVVQVLTPKSGDAFLDDLVPAAPKQEWVQKLTDAKMQLFVPKTEGLLASFSQTFNIDLAQLQPFFVNLGNVDLQNLGNGGQDLSDIMKSARFDEWGDPFSCELIEVDELTHAQATEDQPMNGVDLGIQLTQNVGSEMSYPPLASKLLKKINEKKNAPPGEAMEGLGATDLLGVVKLKTKTVVKEKKEARTDSEEAGADDSRRRRRKKRSADNKNLERKTAKNIPGWKTQFRSPLTDNKTMSDTGVIWYGLGNCQQEKPPPIELHASKNPNKLIEYFMRVLRIECMAKAKDQITDLFNEGYITFSETEEYFEMSKSNTHIHELRLVPSEIRKLSLAFEFSAFSKIYHTLRSKGAPTQGFIEEPNCIITRSVSFLTELTLYYIMKARKVIPAHSVRLTRNLLKTLRTVLTKLHQDILALHEECPDKCDLDKRLTNGDKFRVMSLIQFIIHGMGPYNRGEKLKPSFYSFVGNNKKQIQERLDEFARQYPMKKKTNFWTAKGKEGRRKRRSV